jgi:phosphate transport system substrate-binding protein
MFFTFSLTSCSSNSNFVKPAVRKKIVLDPCFSNYCSQANELYTNYNYRGELLLIENKEIDCANSFLKGKFSTMIIGRDLNQLERKSFEDRKVKVFSESILRDAVVFVCNKNQADSLWNMNELEQVFTGKKEVWKNGAKIQVVFDGLQASNFNFVQEKFKIKTYPSTIRTLNSAIEVINFIEKNDQSIGVISLGSISSLKSKKIQALRGKITLIALSVDNKLYYKPLQENLVNNKYPFERRMWFHTLHRRSTLEGGLLDFMVNKSGQLLADKCGLVQGIRTGREIEISTQQPKRRPKKS